MNLFDLNGKESKTLYNVLWKGQYNSIKISLVEFEPETGRKHQIRKQLLIHGCPILGDIKYRLGRNYTKNKETLMLHAYKINFSIAETRYNFSAPLPLTFVNTLKEKYLKTFR